MRAIIQRVSKAQVKIANEPFQEIGPGMVVLVGYHKNDDISLNDWLINKILKLRIFSDDQGNMNLSLQETKGSILLVSQFTLYANLEHGNRPSFSDALSYDCAHEIYNDLVTKISQQANVKTGVFGAQMQISLVNDGPVTIIIENPTIDN